LVGLGQERNKSAGSPSFVALFVLNISHPSPLLSPL
jgi:hypothetical protein